jgi:energy-coupling factor transporter ATP-binding protein EcfA2
MSDACIRIDNLSYTYPARETATLTACHMTVARGEFVLLAGPTGCGKSTLLKAVNGLIPHHSSGMMQGSVQVAGLETHNHSMAVLSQKVGLVFQNPDDQLFATTVEDEVAFGPENLALPGRDIQRRVAECLGKVGLGALGRQAPQNLSGGQKQRLAIAAVLSMAPEILLLDEPFAQLDPAGTQEVLTVIKRLNRQGMTVVLVEHRLHEMARVADRLVVMRQGRIAADGPVRKVFERSRLFRDLGLRVPQSVTFSWAAGFKEVALTPGEIKRRVNGRALAFPKKIAKEETGRKMKPGTAEQGKARTDPVLELQGVYFRYAPKAPDILKDVNLKVHPGEMVALMGSNGCGKSTLLWHCAGLLKPVSGRVTAAGCSPGHLKPWKTAGRIGIVFQNPTLMLFNETVQAELGFGPRALGFASRDLDAQLERVAGRLGVADLLAENPLALSAGQRLRVAAGSVLTMGPLLILLDEPTSGQDRHHAEGLLGFLREQTQSGKTVLFSTHDVETALRYATRLIVMAAGRIAADGPPRDIVKNTDLLRQSRLRPPEALRIGRALNIEAFTAEELLEALSCRA